MPGDRWQKLANLRSLYAYMWAHPGKKLLFMGQEFAQEAEWSHERSLDWHLLENPEHAGIQSLVRDLNHAYQRRAGAVGDGLRRRRASGGSRPTTPTTTCSPSRAARKDSERVVVFVGNLSPGAARGLPARAAARRAAGARRVNTDSSVYGGSDVGNLGGVEAEADRLARPAVLGRGHAAAARRALARARDDQD